MSEKNKLYQKVSQLIYRARDGSLWARELEPAALVVAFLKHRNSMPVARRASAKVFLTRSKFACKFSSPCLRWYATEMLLYSSESAASAEGVTYLMSV